VGRSSARSPLSTRTPSSPTKSTACWLARFLLGSRAHLSFALVELNGALVRLRFVARPESSEIPPLPRLRILLAGVEAVFP
jgi:hypothetical protein